MVETAIQHEIQSSWVGSIYSYWRNSTKRLIRSKSRSDRISEIINSRILRELNCWIDLFRRKFGLSLGRSRWKSFACLQLITLIWALFHLLHDSVILGPKYAFLSFFAQKHIVVYWQLNWAALGKISRQRMFSFFVAKLRCFKLYDFEKILLFVCC